MDGYSLVHACMHGYMDASAGLLVSCTAGQVTSEGQHPGEQAVQDHTRTPHVHLAAVVSSGLYMYSMEHETQDNMDDRRWMIDDGSI